MTGRPLPSSIGAVLFAALFAATPALATEVVLPPLVPKGSTTTVRDVANVTSLISSELDFMPEVERVIELDKLPTTLNLACLDKTTCLSPIAKGAGGDRMLAGSLQILGDKVTLDLLWFDVTSNRTIRRQAFQLPNRPEAIADNMNAIIREIVTGQAPKGAEEEAAGPSLSLLDLDEDDSFEFAPEDFDAAAADEAARKAQAEAEAARAAAAAERARAEAEAEAKARAEAEARARREAEAQAAARREAEAKARAEAEARARRDAELAALAADDPEEDEFDPNAITFGSAPILVEDDPAPTTRESTYFSDDEPATGTGRILDLDDDEPKAAPKDRDPKPARERAAKPAPSAGGGTFDDEPTSFQLALRGGYSPYYRLGFLTWGVEGAIAVGDTGVHVLAGVQGWSVQREIPERFQTLGGPTTAWDTIFPLNLGVVYKIPVGEGRLRPYGGVDLIGAQYYKPEDGSGGQISIGLRARGGLDFMVVRNFGLTADLAVGFWTGKDWEIIERGVKNAGPLPQISVGAVVAF